MRTPVFVACLFAACGRAPAPAIETRAVGPADAAPNTHPCGAKACVASEICIETSIMQGVQPPPGVEPRPVSFACATAPQSGRGYNCTEVKDQRQSCTVLHTSAAP